jgi:hypothetical protein
MSLSKAQKALLDELYANPQGVYCVSYYRPAKALVELGLASWGSGSVVGVRLGITQKGRTIAEASK